MACSAAHSPLFNSFWLAGFEGADHINGRGQALDMNRLTQHTALALDDYLRLLHFGIRTVRESVGWRLVEAEQGCFDFSSLELRARAAQQLDIQVVWTLCHYGWPIGIDIFSPRFVDRFARYCEATARYLSRFSNAVPVYSPINEISFLAFAVCETGLIHPYTGSLKHRAYELKQNLVRAAIAGCDAIRNVDPRARFIHTDPLIHIVGVDAAHAAIAAELSTHQYQAWDMLAGLSEPQLGGAPDYLDIIGAHHYHTSQWELPSAERLHWHRYDPRRRRFREMLADVHERYGRPLAISETSHFGEGRGEWLREIAAEARAAQQNGVPLEGICVYPILDRPDWEDTQRWHNSGLWDLKADNDGLLDRVLFEPYARDLRRAQHIVNSPVSEFPRSSEVLSVPEKYMPTLIVFSHLRWDFVFQRPQHLMTRLAEHYRVFFIEEPVFHDGPSHFYARHPAFGVCVATPHTPVRAAGFHDEQLPELQELLRNMIEQKDLQNYVVWFYTPMALPLLSTMQPAAVVYDCMDELQAFKNAPRQLVQRESALLKIANIVFTGGRSLYNAKRERNPYVYCFPSSVDANHFGEARQVPGAGATDHRLQQHLPRPRLGFFGVIDERFDLDCVGRLADAHPEWQIVLVGPVVKIDPATLPKRTNIHYVGQQPYAELPSFLAGWDVCLMPFALNESTRFISPTKTLEYMAAELPIVATPIVDVADIYGDIVYIALHDQFVTACEQALAAAPAERQARAEKMRRAVANTSWEVTALEMRKLIEEACTQGLTDGARAIIERDEEASRSRKPSRADSYETIVLGAGPTGLSAAYHLNENTLLLERNATVGGWCRSVEDKGFTFDYAGHIMFSNDEYVHRLYKMLLGDNVHWQNREAWIYSKDVYTRYPFQGALYGLPPAVLKECIVGAIEARFGTLNSGGSLNGSAPGALPATQVAAPAGNATLRKFNDCDDCCADGVSACVASVGVAKAEMADKKAGPLNFEEFIYQVWGAGVAKHFAIPYNKKLWAVPLAEMETSWLGGRVPLPNLEEMIAGALEPVGKPVGPNARFGYPLRGGFQALMNGFLPHLPGQLRLNAEAAAISPARKTVTLKDGTTFSYKTLISTLPLPELVRMVQDEAPMEIRKAVRGLRHVSVRCVNLGIGRENITDKHWIYYPEDSIFHRIFVQGNASPHCNAPGGFGITCEISYSEYKPLPVDGEQLIQRCIADCIKVGMISEHDTVIAANQVDMPYAYVVYDHARAENVKKIKAWLTRFGIIASGRYGEWEYYNSDHAFIAGKKAAESADEMQTAAVAASGARTA